MKKENFERMIDILIESSAPFPQVGADNILNPKLRGKLEQGIDNVLHSFNSDEVTYSKTEKCETLIEILLNLIGMERKRVGFSDKEIEKTLRKIITTLKKWEKNERKDEPITKAVIEKFLQELKQVGLGKSMVAKIAENVEKKLDDKNLIESFIMALKHEIENNVYYKMVDKDMSKFGNDSATGLRFVRHFDFVQVSSNPVIAANAYKEFPNLWDNFKEIVKLNPEWQKNPDKYADEIAMYATITSLLPNLLIFRPLALLSDFRDGLVSYQLNPFLAEDVEASVKDAQKICSILKEILYKYDAWLGWSPDEYKGRPNIVFKVAASSEAAMEITGRLNSQGIGSNNTVTYSVEQEIMLLFAEVAGMANALKKGIPITQVYQTNMIGRLADHLRESEAERLVNGLTEEEFKKFEIEIGAEAKGNREKRTKILCSRKAGLKSLTDPRFAKFFPQEDLEKLETAIQHSGIYVTRKVYKLFFSPKNAKKWQTYIKKMLGFSDAQIKEIANKIDILPASKRKADDTYQVLGMPNVTNTEFPTHQLVVWEKSLKKEFNLKKYKNSIKADPDPAILKSLLQIENFRKAYGLTKELMKTLKETLGIEYDNIAGGMEPENWSKFGAVIKTMTEFKNAYLDFKKEAIKFVKSAK